MSTTTIRLDDELKKEVTQRLDALGMNFNTFVVMAAKQLVAQNKLPFATEVPKNETYDEQLARFQKLLDRADYELTYERDKAIPLSQVAEEFEGYQIDWYTVSLTFEANQNLKAITDYIAFNLCSPLTATKTHRALIKGLEKLRFTAYSYPYLKNRKPKFKLNHDLQHFLLYKKYLAFFYVDKYDKAVYVTNILTSGQDFALLFGDD